MPTETELRDQLVRLIEVRCVDPLDILLQDDRTTARLRTRVRSRAGEWARELLEADERTAVGIVMRMIAVLYPSDEPFDPPLEWWSTALGQVVALRVGHPTAVRVSYSIAGAMLGISKQGVHDLLERGKLDRHPEGGVRPRSVRDRLRATPSSGRGCRTGEAAR